MIWGLYYERETDVSLPNCYRCKQPITPRGECGCKDGICLIHGDCRSILPLLEAGSVDLVLTDPPYGTQNLGGGYGRRQNHDPNGKMGRTIQGDTDLSVAREAMAMLPVETGYIGMFASSVKLKEAIGILPGEYFGEVVWLKGAPGLGYTVRYSHESLLLSRIGTPTKPEKALLSVVNKPRCTSTAHLRHPHEKPVAFWQRMLALPGDLILDPFAGSGTTGHACKLMGRKCIMIELEEKYCEIAVERLRQEVLF